MEIARTILEPNAVELAPLSDLNVFWLLLGSQLVSEVDFKLKVRETSSKDSTSQNFLPNLPKDAARWGDLGYRAEIQNC